MEETVTADSLKTMISFPFRDERWVGKLLLASAWVFLSFIPVLPQALLLGYVALIILQVVETGEPSLPAWDDFSRIFRHGLRLFGLGFVYLLPVILLVLIGYGAMFLSVFTLESSVVPEGAAVASVIISYLVGFGLMGIGALLGFGISLFLPVAGCHLVVEDEFAAGFRFKEWWPIFRANWDGFLVSFLLLFGGGMLAYYASQFLIFTVILCCFYPLIIGVLGAYFQIVGGALFARAYRVGRENLNQVSE